MINSNHLHQVGRSLSFFYSLFIPIHTNSVRWNSSAGTKYLQMTIENSNLDELRKKYPPEQLEAANVLMKELKSTSQSQDCEWDLHETQGTNGGLVVQKTKKSGEVVLYEVSDDEKESS